MHSVGRTTGMACRAANLRLLDGKLKKTLPHPRAGISTASASVFSKLHEQKSDLEKTKPLTVKKINTSSSTMSTLSTKKMGKSPNDGRISDDEDDTEPATIQSKKNGKRKFYSFSKNFSIARQCESKHSHVNCSIKASESKAKSSSKSNKLVCRVKDHAQRRLLIFYYLLVAYHEEKCLVSRDKTNLQHGSSNCPFCNAAHSSILPNVTDNFFKKLAESIISKGSLDESARNKLTHLGASKDSLDTLNVKSLPKREWKQLFRGLGIKGKLKLIPTTSQLYQNMNSTVELPIIVNKVDSLIEHQLRSRAIDILNEVSKGNIVPYKGLQQLVEELQAFFKTSLEGANAKKDSLATIFKLESELHRLEESLCANTIKHKHVWLKKYFETAKQLQQVFADFAAIAPDHTPSITRTICSPKHLELFQWMKQQEEKNQKYAKSIDQPQELEKYCRELYNGAHTSPNLELSVKQLKKASHSKGYKNKNRSVTEMKKAISDFWETCDPLEKLFCQKDRVDTIFQHIEEVIQALPHWDPHSVESDLKLLQSFCQVIDWQASGSVALPAELLSGKCVDKTLQPPTKEDLFLQKLEIIKR